MTHVRSSSLPCSILALTLVVSAGSGRAAAQSGQLDPSFGAGGIVLGTASQERAVAIARQGNGLYVVAGGLGNGAFLRRHLADGSLDPSFGTGGHASFGSLSFVTGALALDGSDRILLTGSLAGEHGVLRFTASGALDTTFGTGGAVRVTAARSWWGRGLVVQPDGRIVTSGSGTQGTRLDASLVVARLLTNGSLDTTFGTGAKKKGYVVVDFGSGATVRANPRQLVLFGDGSLLAGAATDSGGAWHTALVRLQANGTPVPTFGTAGVLHMSFHPYSLTGHTNGGIVIGGTTAEPNSVRRLLANGTLDATFGTSGVVHLAPGGTATHGQVVARGDGRLLVALTVPVDPTTAAVVPMALLADGAPDASFGAGGLGAAALVSGMTLYPSGGLLVDGASWLLAAGIGDAPVGQFSFVTRHQL